MRAGARARFVRGNVTKQYGGSSRYRNHRDRTSWTSAPASRKSRPAGIKNFACPICNRRLRTKEGRETHIRVKHPADSHQSPM
jgi:hypothetical protein